MNKHEIGKIGEKYAGEFLISQNYGILEKNFRTKFGEIDLIAKDHEKNETVFVEVKTRTSIFFGEPQDAVQYFKRKKLLKTALYFLNSSTEKRDLCWRMDIIAVKLEKSGKLKEITHFKNILNGA